MTNLTKPTLYYIKHPLSDGTLSEQALASFSEEDVAEYRSEYDEYLTTQHQATKDMNVLCNDAMTYIRLIFGSEYDSKQVRYFERATRNGETFVDKHSHQYPPPDTDESSVHSARQKYCSFMGNDNAPTVGGEDTLQEINTAVSFLLKRGLSLNADFTVSNAVRMAKTLASQDFDDECVSSNKDGISVANHNMIIKGGTPFPSNSFAVYSKGGNNLGLKLIDINVEYDEMDEGIKKLVDEGAKYSVSFVASDEPTFEVC